MDGISVGLCILGMILIPIGLFVAAVFIMARMANVVCRLFLGKPLFAGLETDGLGDPWYGGSGLKAETVEETALRRKRAKEAEAQIRERRRMDQLSLSYYVRDASVAGHGQNEIREALRQKGWSDDDIAAAFSACGLAAENL